jgi:hypothetical protein
MNKSKPLISAHELDALIGGWGYSSSPAMVDKFFPIRIVLLITLGTLASFSLLFLQIIFSKLYTIILKLRTLKDICILEDGLC